MKASDPLDEASGTNGLTGSADTLMILTRKKRTSRTGKLIICGRDLPGEEYDIAFSEDKKSWEVMSVGSENDSDSDSYIVSLTANFAKQEAQWQGTATELLEKLNGLDPMLSIKANRLSAILFEYRAELLAEYRVKLEKERTSSRKTISLTWLGDDDDSGDGYDAYDDSDDGICKATAIQSTAGYISSLQS